MRAYTSLDAHTSFHTGEMYVPYLAKRTTYLNRARHHDFSSPTLLRSKGYLSFLLDRRHGPWHYIHVTDWFLYGARVHETAHEAPVNPEDLQRALSRYPR